MDGYVVCPELWLVYSSCKVNQDPICYGLQWKNNPSLALKIYILSFGLAGLRDFLCTIFWTSLRLVHQLF